ncbi:MAG: hypothetical protein BGN92_11370 [Sphingobacteriales bacterium 41-5]|nr:MAG: hypothetical protein BGN92_11370 [Sphingobacteriales bacterium 41-5]
MDTSQICRPAAGSHVVFTLPQELTGLALQNPKEVYDILFAAAWQSINTFAKNKGLNAGMVCIAHTRSKHLHYTHTYTALCRVQMWMRKATLNALLHERNIYFR